MSVVDDDGRSGSISDSPLPGASFRAAVSRYFKKYAVFTGRASRSEYWWVWLFSLLIGIIPAALLMTGVIVSAIWAAQNPLLTSLGYDANGDEVVYATSPGLIHAPTGWMIFLGLGLMLVLRLALVVPNLALTWRRMHDSNHPGLLTLLVLIPFVGALVVLVFMVLSPNPAGARFDRQ